MESAKYPFCPFRRKITLDVGDDKNQDTQKDHDFDCIIDKKMNTCSPTVCGINSQEIQQVSYQAVESVHPQDFVLQEIPGCFYCFHKSSFYLYIEIYRCNILKMIRSGKSG